MEERFETAVIGGGASGLFCASHLLGRTLIVERGDRLGKKLAATGNGQGNITNGKMGAEHYFSSSKSGREKISSVLSRYGKDELISFFSKLGALIVFDERGRAYPSGKQASALCDLIRFSFQNREISTVLNAYCTKIEKTADGFLIQTSQNGQEITYFAKNVVICAGGKSAKNFGTDGNGYALAKPFSHSTTALFPSLVQMKTEKEKIKQLKGIRVADCALSLYENGEKKAQVVGDVIFTDYGVSGDAVFQISAFLSGAKNAVLSIDFLPSISRETLHSILEEKAKLGYFSEEELLCGVLNNALGRSIVKRVGKSGAVDEIKDFRLPVLGTLGFDYAQTTKGGIKLDEVDENLQSKFASGLYFAGEILDVDGECGGYNLQWAFSSACTVANAINKNAK